MNNSVMTSRQAAELDHAFGRNGFTAQDVKKLSEGDILAKVREVILGRAEIKQIAKWYEKDGVIYFTVTSDGKSGKDWVKYFESRSIKVDDYAKQLLLSEDFKSSKKGTILQVAVIKGGFFLNVNTSKIREKADEYKFRKPNAEVACLIRDMFTDEEIKEIGLGYIVAMHEPIKDSGGALRLLSTGWNSSGSWLAAHYSWPDYRWNIAGGFAFALPQE